MYRLTPAPVNCCMRPSQYAFPFPLIPPLTPLLPIPSIAAHPDPAGASAGLHLLPVRRAVHEARCDQDGDGGEDVHGSLWSSGRPPGPRPGLAAAWHGHDSYNECVHPASSIAPDHMCARSPPLVHRPSHMGVVSRVSVWVLTLRHCLYCY